MKQSARKLNGNLIESLNQSRGEDRRRGKDNKWDVSRIKPKAELTDDAEVVERAGHTAEIVSGSYDNIKITTPEDLKLAEMMLVKC